ncbi:DUF3592 domain-containing protein [Corynebacterium sp. H128]|uniref:DUF3592 domain-containing protein n=1 Tax=unclassified Corynebacterium TaxID=2624378 RepID=UPI0030B07172
MNVHRRVTQLVLALYICAVIGCAAMVLGPLLNDRDIAENRGRALARVTSVSSFRTTVDYQDESGIFHTPRAGVLYPGGLGAGQRVWVEYSKSNPELVKVEGRAWTLALLPALSIWAVATGIFAALLALLSWWRRRLGITV